MTLPHSLFWCLLGHLDFYHGCKLGSLNRALLAVTQKYYLQYPQHINHLWVLIILHPHATWDWNEISANPNITPVMVREHFYLPWNWAHICRNPNFTWADITGWSWSDNLRYVTLPRHALSGWIRKWTDYIWTITSAYLKRGYSAEYLSLNPNITWDFVLAHPEIKWYYPWLSANRNITPAIMKAYSHRNWSLYYYSANANLDWDFVCAKLDPNSFSTNKMDLLSRNSCVTWDMICSRPDWHWSFPDVILNRNVTPEVIEVTPQLHKPRCRHIANSNFSLDYIIATQEDKQLYDGFYLSLNRNLTWRYIYEQKFKVDFNWYALSMNLFTASPVLRDSVNQY